MYSLNQYLSEDLFNGCLVSILLTNLQVASRVTRNKSQSHVMVQRAPVIWTPTIFLKSSLPPFTASSLATSATLLFLEQPNVFLFRAWFFFCFWHRDSPTLNIEGKRQVSPTSLPSESLLLPPQCLPDSAEMSPPWRDRLATDSQRANSPPLSHLFIMLCCFFSI